MLRALILAVAVSVTTAQTSTPVVILAPAELPRANSTTGYTIKDEHECLADGKSKGYGLDRYSGGTPGIAICKARCEEEKNCVGFQFAYQHPTNTNRKFQCLPIMMESAAGCAANASDGLHSGRYGGSFWMRDAGPVATGTETSGRLPWVGAGPTVGEDYLAFAGTDCTGGDIKNSELFKSSDGKTAKECEAKCTANPLCMGFNYVWEAESTLKNRCVGKDSTCKLASGRKGVTYYANSARMLAPKTTPKPALSTSDAASLRQSGAGIVFAMVATLFAALVRGMG